MNYKESMSDYESLWGLGYEPEVWSEQWGSCEDGYRLLLWHSEDFGRRLFARKSTMKWRRKEDGWVDCSVRECMALEASFNASRKAGLFRSEGGDFSE